MPVAVTSEAIPAVAVNPPRKRWTRAECEVLERSGLLVNEHLELIDGELITKMGKNGRHICAVALLMNWLRGVFSWDSVWQEAPVEVDVYDRPASQPEPDGTVLNRSVLEFQNSRPKPTDIRLIVEVSDSSLAFDLSVKAALYARAGIVEYWVLDINARRMVVHREPEAGVYRSVVAYGEEESVTPLAAPSAALRVGDVLL